MSMAATPGSGHSAALPDSQDTSTGLTQELADFHVTTPKKEGAASVPEDVTPPTKPRVPLSSPKTPVKRKRARAADLEDSPIAPLHDRACLKRRLTKENLETHEQSLKEGAQQMSAHETKTKTEASLK